MLWRWLGVPAPPCWDGNQTWGAVFQPVSAPGPLHTRGTWEPLNRGRDVFTRTPVGEGEEKDGGCCFLGEEMNNSPQEGSRREEARKQLHLPVGRRAWGWGMRRETPGCWPASPPPCGQESLGGRGGGAWMPASPPPPAAALLPTPSDRSLIVVMCVFPASGF